MNRTLMLQSIIEIKEWDIVIIGGGATGLGTAVDAANRGYKTLLLEQSDFAKGTSSKSTKLVHGGVRYLAQGNIKLVREALKERGLLLKNAPHLTKNISFVLPCYSIVQKIYYAIGLSIYDLMSGKLGLGKTKIISKNKVIEKLPTITTKNLKGAIIYQDGQFDDARLAINLATTATEKGATILNYFKVNAIQKNNNKVCGVMCLDILSKKEYIIKSKIVINATGIFTDDILHLDDPTSKDVISISQGIHIVLDKKYFSSTEAMMIPKTNDGRVLFAVPWHNKVVFGTTDTPIKSKSLEPKPLIEEVAFLITHINKYLSINITKSDVQSVFVGLRPLVNKGIKNKTSILPRDHTILISNSNLITITGGKWTTYRKMADDVLSKAIKIGHLTYQKCTTEQLKIHGWQINNHQNCCLQIYGSDAIKIKELCQYYKNGNQLIHPHFNNIQAEIIWAVRYEMAVNVEDILARRTRILFLDASAAIQAAPIVAQIMAVEMNKDDVWIENQLTHFNLLAKQYLLS